MTTLSPRHGGSHHTINIKYGYIVFGLTVAFALLIYGWGRVLLPRSWLDKGYPPEIKTIRSRKAQLALQIVCWSAILLGIAFFHINLPDQYVTQGKRFGRLAYALIPLDLLLVIRPGVLGNYLDFIDLHKWISRLIFAALTEHSIVYYYKWWKAGAVIEKSFKILNLLGIIVFWIFVGFIIISLKFFRNRYYGLFYIYHNTAMLLMIVLIPFHARPGVNFFAIVSVALLLLQLYNKVRYLNSITLEVVESKPGSKLQLVRFVKPSTLSVSWLPGSHIRLTGLLFGEFLLPSHPYTVASLASDELVHIIIQKSNFSVLTGTNYAVAGPFESSVPYGFYENVNQKTVAIICGGSGISFGLPIHRHLQSVGVNSRLAWVVRSKADLYILDHFPELLNIDVYVTGRPEEMVATNDDVFEVEELLDEEAAVELEDMGATNPENPFDDSNLLYKIHRGRPQLDDIGITLEGEQNPWIIACGPAALVDDAEKWCALRSVHFISETYLF